MRFMLYIMKCKIYKALNVGHNSPYSVKLYPLYGGVLHIIDVGLGLLMALLMALLVVIVHLCLLYIGRIYFHLSNHCILSCLSVTPKYRHHLDHEIGTSVFSPFPQSLNGRNEIRNIYLLRFSIFWAITAPSHWKEVLPTQQHTFHTCKVRCFYLLTSYTMCYPLKTLLSLL